MVDRSAEPIMCCTMGHENLPADYLGVYDEGCGAEADVPYCDPCALEVAQHYRVTKNLRVPAETQLRKMRAQLEALANALESGARKDEELAQNDMPRFSGRAAGRRDAAKRIREATRG